MSAPINLSSIAREMDVSIDTIKRHAEYLRDAFLLVPCQQKDEKRWVPRKGARAKLYAIDPTIARLPYLLNAARRDIEPSVLSEMQLFNILQKRVLRAQTTADNDARFFYYRSPNGKEIDLVSEHLGDTAIESKYIESGEWRGESRTLTASLWKGLIATRNVLDVRSDEDNWAVPTGILAYLLDADSPTHPPDTPSMLRLYRQRRHLAKAQEPPGP
jgi:predicted AAA+ superfamily ATPase